MALLGQTGYASKHARHLKGHHMRHAGISASVITALILAAAAPSKAQDRDMTVVTPDKLNWVSTPVAPTNKIAWSIGSAAAAGKFYVLFAKYPPEGRSMPHIHPDERIVTVLTGTFYLGSGPVFDETKEQSRLPQAASSPSRQTPCIGVSPRTPK